MSREPARNLRHGNGIGKKGTLVALTVDIGSPSDMRAAFEGAVLGPADAKAIEAIRRGSMDAALAVMVIPNTALDIAAFLTVSVRMTREICAAYGLRPSSLGAMLILRRAIVGSATIGIVDTLADLAGQVTGEAIAGKLSASIAGASTAGLKTARLGLCVMSAVRPLDFVGVPRPGVLTCFKPSVLASGR